MWKIIDLLVWIGIWNKLRIYRVPPDSVRQYSQGSGYLWRNLMIIWILISRNDLKVSHMKQVNAPSNMRLATFLTDLNVKNVGYFKVFDTIKKMKPLLLLYFQILYDW